MVLEVVILDIKPELLSEYEHAFEEAQKIISSRPGYISHQLQKCIEKPNRYILLVNWQTLIDHTQLNVNGWVKLSFYKGNITILGRDSDSSLFDPEIATFEDDDGAFDHQDAAGFIKLNALRLRIAHKKNKL